MEPEKTRNQKDFTENHRFLHILVVGAGEMPFSQLPELKIENPRKIVLQENCFAPKIDPIVTKQFFFKRCWVES